MTSMSASIHMNKHTIRAAFKEVDGSSWLTFDTIDHPNAVTLFMTRDQLNKLVADLIKIAGFTGTYTLLEPDYPNGDPEAYHNERAEQMP